MNTFNRCGGVVVPMITPFTADGNIDLDSAKKITRHLIDNGAVPFVLGTTGEASSIPLSMRSSYVKAVADAANGDVPVYVGISSNCLADTIYMAEESARNGAVFLVAHLPSYYPLSARQIENYFVKLADLVPLPLVLYNILATTHISVPIDVISRLSHHPNIVGIKDSEQDIDRQLKIIRFCKEHGSFDHLIGWGAKCTEALLSGSNGIVPSTGNFAPGIYRSLFDAARKGDIELADVFQSKAGMLSAIYQKGRILSEALPALKVIMQALDLCGEHVLPPLMPVPESAREKILTQVSELKVSQYASKGKGQMHK
ncbi:MAG: dihydrodipicolinate synthase family protein [Cyclonatronaceae bacterium]